MAHIISSISITNYKSIVNETFEFSSYTPLVGYNNAGKSNILSSIKWLLRKSSLSADAFNQIEHPVVIEGKIEGIDQLLLDSLSDSHRASIEPYVQEGVIKIKRIQNIPSDSVANIKLFIFDPAAVPPAQQWKPNPTGIDNAISALFPEAIQIGAMENAEEDVSKSKSTSTIGKLIAEIIEPIELVYGAQVNGALKGLRGLMDADGENRAEELTAFDNAVNDKISAFFPEINVRLHVPTPELKDVFTKGTIKVYEQQFSDGRDVSSLGHGAQRSIQMALIRHLAEIKRTEQVHTTTTLLLIDEPELYLHPQAIEIVRDALKTLSTEGYQVVFSTHSPMMITQEDVGNTVLVRKNAARGTYRRVTLKSAVATLDAPSQLELLFSLSNSSNILFSEGVVLTEGQTEHKVLPKIIEKITGRSLGLHKLALVKQNGVSNTQKSMKVLSVMNLPTKAVVDLDYAFKQAEIDGFLEANDADVNACRTHLSKIAVANKITLAADGWPMRGNGSLSAAKAFSVLAAESSLTANIESLHAKLLAKNIWFWKMGAIEQHLGLEGKSESHWANYVNNLKTRSLEDLAPDHLGINQFVKWLTS